MFWRKIVKLWALLAHDSCKNMQPPNQSTNICSPTSCGVVLRKVNDYICIILDKEEELLFLSCLNIRRKGLRPLFYLGLGSRQKSANIADGSRVRGNPFVVYLPCGSGRLGKQRLMQHLFPDMNRRQIYLFYSYVNTECLQFFYIFYLSQMI